MKEKQLCHGIIQSRYSARKFARSVTGSRRMSVPKLALVSSDVLPSVTKTTGSLIMPSAWDAEVRVVASARVAESSVLDALLRKQMAANGQSINADDYCIQRLAPDAGNSVLKKIASLEKQDCGGRPRPLGKIKTAMERHMMVVATKGNGLASFLFVSRRQNALLDGVTLYDLQEPVVAEKHPASLGNALVRYAVDSIHCFSPDKSLVVAMERPGDPESSAAMVRMGFTCSAPVVRTDGVHFLWVYDTAADLEKRTDLSGDQSVSTAERVKKLFHSNPQISIDEIVRTCRVPDYSEARLRALKAVSTMEAKSGKKTQSRPPAAQPVQPPIAAQPGQKPRCNNMDDVRAAVRATNPKSLDEFLSNYDVNPALDDKPKKLWRVVAVIAANTLRLSKSGKKTQAPKAPKPNKAKPVVQPSQPPAKKHGKKPYLATLDDVRAAVRATNPRSLDEFLSNYDVNPALDDKPKKLWRVVAVIAANTLRKQRK